MDARGQTANASTLAAGGVGVLVLVAIGIVIATEVTNATGVSIALLNTARDTFLPLLAFTAIAVGVIVLLRVIF